MRPTKAVLTVNEATSLLDFTLSFRVLVLKMKKKKSTSNPYNRAKIKVNGAVDSRQKAVKKPPIIAT